MYALYVVGAYVGAFMTREYFSRVAIRSGITMRGVQVLPPWPNVAALLSAVSGFEYFYVASMLATIYGMCLFGGLCFHVLLLIVSAAVGLMGRISRLLR